MNGASSAEENRLLDNVIARRRSIRVFKSEAPPEAWIEQVIHAGLQAPYAGLAAKAGVPYRLFRIIRQGPTMVAAQELIKGQAREELEELKAEMARNAYVRENGKAFQKAVEALAEHGIPSLRDAPYFIVVAERRGIPSVEFESLAHCLENMWLKATALGLGFQVLSSTKTLSQNPRFFELLHLELGEFLLNGCALGYPGQAPAEKHLFPVSQVLEWLPTL